MPAESKPGWMLPCRAAWLALTLLLLLVLAPTAGAFATREEPLRVAYDQDASPVVFATGALAVEGRLERGYLASDVRGFALSAVPELTVTERGLAGLPRNQTHRDVDVDVQGGALIWEFGAGDRLDLALAAPYGVGLALPQLPVAAGADAGAGLLVAAPALEGAFSWSGRAGRLVLLDASVTLRDASGAVLPGWAGRRVNANATAGSEPSDLDAFFHVSGAFEGVSDARMQGGAMGRSASLTLTVSDSGQDRFLDTLDVLERATEALGGEESAGLGRDNPLRGLAPYSGVLDGSLLVLGDTPGPDGEPIEPVESRMGEAAFDVGPMALVRGEMDVAWDAGQMRVQGTPVVALTSAGFAVEEPASLAGLVPILSLALWALAAAAIVVYFVKRPREGKGSLAMRLVSLAVHLVALAAVFWWWDASFAQTFGTSALTLLREGALLEDPVRLFVVLSLELAPWGVAALLFALPVRILLGVALRYVGRGKTYKGVAKAGGLVALGVLGPLYALWLVNVTLGQMLEHVPAMTP